MLQVYVDDRTLPAPPATCRTLEELVSLVRREHLSDGRIVQKLVVNGQNYFMLEPEYRDYVMRDPDQFRHISTVEITSASTSALAHESIVGAIHYSESLLLGLQSIAEKFRSGQIQEGFYFYTGAVKGLASLMELLSSLEQVLQTDFTCRVVNGLSVRASLDGIEPKISALVAAQERNDLVTMADLLEYDIHDTVAHWKLVLQDFAKAAENGSAPAAQGSECSTSTPPAGLPVSAAAPIKVL